MYVAYLFTLASVVWSLPSTNDILPKPGIDSGIPIVLDGDEPLLKEVDSLKKSPEENSRQVLSENYTNIIPQYLYQGDLLLSKDEFAAIHRDNSTDPISRKKRQALYGKHWPGGNVYYYLDGSVDQRKQISINAALEYLQSRTCITFIRNPGAPNRIRVSNANPGICQSQIGMDRGEQRLLLGPGCEVMGTAAHEFIHALGFWHTQMRYDRDQYVQIDTSRVREENVHNFAKTTNRETVNLVPYEYGSVMHYPAHAFDEGNGVSVIPRDNEYLYTIGSHIISFYDIDMINRRYECNGRCGSSITCANGGVPNPRNCAVCNCPLGYGGPTCQERPPGCGQNLEASSSWQRVQITVGNRNQGERDIYTMCNHWITAPQGATIQVRIAAIEASCGYACSYSGIEVKTRPDQKMTNPRYCCRQFAGKVLQSSLNPTPIISYTRAYAPTFVVEYRYVNGVGPVGPGQTTPQPSNCRDDASEQACYQIYYGNYCRYQQYAVACRRTCQLCR